MTGLYDLLALTCVSWLLLALTLLIDWWNRTNRPVQNTAEAGRDLLGFDEPFPGSAGQKRAA